MVFHPNKASPALQAIEPRVRDNNELHDEVSVALGRFLSFPDDVQPKWYLEPGIAQRDPEEYCLPSKSCITTGDVVNHLTSLTRCHFLMERVRLGIGIILEVNCTILSITYAVASG